MTEARVRSFAALLTTLLMAAASPVAAQPTPTPATAPAPGATELHLTAHGGATVQVPSWKEIRKDAAIAVLEQLPDPAAQKPYYVLMCAMEEGPPAGAPIPWGEVRDNIVRAASKNGRKLTLEVGEPFAGAAAFEGRRLLGSLESGTPGKKVALELIALVRDGKLLTIGLIAEQLGAAENELLIGVAKTARLGP